MKRRLSAGPVEGRFLTDLDRLEIPVFSLKRVTTMVRVNACGEWVRWNNGGPRGMPSPLLQARHQLDVLDRLLGRN